MKKGLNNRLRIVVDTLKENYKNKVAAIFLYGSSVSGKSTLNSDIDIALILNDYTDEDKYSLYTIMDEMSAGLKKKIDLVLFNDTSPILKMQIIKKHILVYVNNRKTLYEEITKGISQYFDLKICRREIEKNIAEGSIYAG